ncbi:FAD-binding oxidoreductase [Mucilaginibacter sp. X4EP1]|uniref:ferredoxin--NADP reductase n=1 Tax=Mucilaginibacter sp. X4EP1 TaxID=2723092 RepID=UPI002167447F|nr:ferredoxin--NADP reductase [Mucilaginibacter sp. X4EP1]MCS3815425.1 ring-1,2-phenylacetyl-CoA epoxidase subunit PaaE [Mucilaginibacter sp. X4EP1]
MLKYTLKVEMLRKETADTITVCFKQPALKKVKYQAGQYLTLIFNINGRRYIRPYSFSSSPGIDPFLEVTVKRVPGGVVSNHIFDKVSVGDLIEVIEPMGDFVINESIISNNSHVFLWGAGSGITPLFSIIKHLLHNHNLKVTLVYGNRNFESVIFYDQLTELAKQYSDAFALWHFHTQLIVKEDCPNIIQGRIQTGEVLSLMNKTNDINNSVHFICGPTGLKESVKKGLNILNIPAANIYAEDFELVKDEKELAEIITRSVKIEKDGTCNTLEVTKGKSILEAGLDALIDLPYSCQVGNCLLCKGKLLNGQLKYAGLETLPTGLQNDEYLLCCTYPLTDDVEVSLN